MTVPFIYRIRLQGTNKCYVGSAKTVRKRWNLHKSQLRRNIHHAKKLQKAWNKHGEAAFSFELVDVCSSDQRRKCETFWIEVSNSCFNSVRAADGRFELSDSHKSRISAALKGNNNRYYERTAEIRKAVSERMKGTTLSAETRAKISAANRGRKLSAETRAKMSKARKGVSTKGHKQSPETRARISAALKDRPRGRMSAETRAKISDKLTGIKQSNSTRAKRAESLRAYHRNKAR